MPLADAEPVLTSWSAASLDVAARRRVSVDADGRFAHREEAVAPVLREACGASTRDELLEPLDRDDGAGEARLACGDRRVVARAAVSAQWHGDARFDEIAVERASSRGRARLDRAADWAHAHTLGGLTTLDTLDSNAAACRFHARRGFVPGGLVRRVHQHLRRGAVHGYRPFAAGEGGA
ncbi:hypothetical protein Bsp3421_001684 [Burkholderia sp. FERM BP-3421]|nr:hypothetical protein Bsp3421_001684 [Burkholderia sp. FERM BP-3421]